MKSPRNHHEIILRHPKSASAGSRAVLAGWTHWISRRNSSALQNPGRSPWGQVMGIFIWIIWLIFFRGVGIPPTRSGIGRSTNKPTMWGPRSIVKLVHITPISLWVYGTQITIVMGVYKPTFTSLGGPTLYGHLSPWLVDKWHDTMNMDILEQHLGR